MRFDEDPREISADHGHHEHDRSDQRQLDSGGATLVAAEIEQSDGGGVPVSDVRGYPDLDSARRLYVKSYQPLSKREEQQIDGLLGEYGRALGVLEKTLTNDGRVADARSVRAVVEASGERRWRVVRQGSAGNGLVLHYAFDRRPA